MATIELVGMWFRESTYGEFLCGQKLSRKELIERIEKAQPDPEGFVTLALFSTTKSSEKAPDKKLSMMISSAGEQRQPERQAPAPKPEPKADYYPPPPEDDIPF